MRTVETGGEGGCAAVGARPHCAVTGPEPGRPEAIAHGDGMDGGFHIRIDRLRGDALRRAGHGADRGTCGRGGVGHRRRVRMRGSRLMRSNDVVSIDGGICRASCRSLVGRSRR